MPDAASSLALPGTLTATLSSTLTGTPAQVEWATRIQTEIHREFDRVAAALLAAAASHPARLAETEAFVEILQEKRAEVLAHRRAGYFIKEWQEPGGQVRRLLLEDPRYRAIRAQRAGNGHS